MTARTWKSWLLMLALGGLASSLTVQQAWAQEAVPVQLSYQSPAGCPTRAEFIGRLRMHTRLLRFSDAKDSLELDVKVSKRETDFSGRLAVLRADEAMGSRQFNDSDCTKVVWALALSAALSIDPEATLSVPDAGSGGAPVADPAQANQSDSGSAPREPSNAAAEPTQAPTDAPPDVTDEMALRPTVAAEAADFSADYRWMLGPSALLSFSFQPKVAPGGGVALNFRDTAGGSVWPWDLYLELNYYSTRPTRGDDPLRIDWLAANAVYCPLRLQQSATLLMCAGMLVGVIAAEGLGLEAPRHVTRSWLAAGAGIRGRLPIGDRWELTANLDISLPLVQRAFAVEPDRTVVARSRVVGANVGLGALYGF